VIALAVALVLLAAAAGVGYVLYERSTRTVALLAADVPGDDPFTPTLVQGGSFLPTVRFDAAANRTPAGDLDGLYLDSTGSPACNRTQLESILRGDQALATAWAAALGAPEPSAFAAGLIPVRLRADTRLTAHGRADGRAQPFAATLQAGTAVLVDDRGQPRVRCADGAPLTAAQPLADPVYGRGWDGFDPASMIEIRPASAPVVEFGLVDAAGAEPFRRPAGSTGEDDVAARPDTGRLEGGYVLTGNRIRCDGLETCPSETLTLVPRFAGCPDACVVSEPELGERVAVTRDGAVWRAGGTVPLEYRGVLCEGRAAPYTFTTTITVQESQVKDGALDGHPADGRP
jgi:hypothetical protein